jgi:hypothetical protein
LQALVEILLLAGGTPYANFKDLAHAWGREKGFHHLLAASVCERRGEVERKKRSDAGRTMTDSQRQAFKASLKKSKLNKEGSSTVLGGADNNDDEDDDDDDDNEDDDDEDDDIKPAIDEMVEPRNVEALPVNTTLAQPMEVDDSVQV